MPTPAPERRKETEAALESEGKSRLLRELARRPEEAFTRYQLKRLNGVEAWRCE